MGSFTAIFNNNNNDNNNNNNNNETIFAVFMSAVASVTWAAAPQPRGFLFVPSHGQVEQEQERNVFFVKYLVL